MLDQLRHAAGAGTEVELSYYSYGRDAYSTRVVAPWRVFADSGNWYVHGWCHLAEGERIFRVDRIEQLIELDRPAARRPDTAEEGRGNFHPRAGDPRVTLELAPDAAWVIDAYPCESVEELADGRIRATLVITAVPWLERLLVRLGRSAAVVDSDGLPEAERLADRAAERILTRYG
jgi:proteasome accessory factor C